MLDENPQERRIVWAIRRRLPRIGIQLEAFYITREYSDPQLHPEITVDQKYRYSQLFSEDLDHIHSVRPDMNKARYGRLLEEGKRCYGLWDGDKLVAKMWMNLEEFSAAFYSHPLNKDEVYLFDAFSNTDYRGQNLAPYLRLKCYEEARKLGKPKIYSLTDFNNVAARRFKAKLGARHASLKLHIAIGSFFSSTWTLRSYNSD